MIKLVHKFDGGKSVLTNDGKFHNETMIGKFVNGKKLAVKIYKSNAGAQRALAVWNAALGDYAQAEAA